MMTATMNIRWSSLSQLMRYGLLTFLALFLFACSTSTKATRSGGEDSGQVTVREEDEINETLRAGATEIPKEIEEFTVDGLKVILRPTGSSFHTVVTKLYIRGGLPALPDGVSPAIEQMALDVPRFSGPAWMERSEFLRERDRMHLGLGASAERDFSTLTLRCVDENFDRAWSLFSGMITEPSFDPIAMENIRERAIIGVRNRSIVPESYAEYLADSVFFYGHPYGRVAEEADFTKITEQDLRDYHKQLFVKSRLFLVVVGNITREEITEKIKASLGTLAQGSYKDPKVAIPKNASHPSLLVQSPWGREDIPTNYLVVRFLGPDHKDKLFYAMERLRSFMGGFLFREIRIERNLSYAPDASTYNHRIGFGDISISTVLPDSAWRVTKSRIIDFFRDNIIKDEYLSEVPATWYTGQYLGMQTAESQATELGSAWFYKDDWKEAYRALDRFTKVTPEQLNEAAVKYMDNFTIVVVGDPEDVTRSEYLPEDVSTDDEASSDVPAARSR
ncbi:MAG: M16 family metallopeptidase [Candidatus Kapaibacterium sp.]